MQNSIRCRTNSLVIKKQAKSVLLSNYELKQTIGKGGFAKVKRATHLPTAEDVAVKILNKNTLSTQEVNRVYYEIDIQRKLFHQNIARIYEVVEDDYKIYIFMEYCRNGEVFDYINNNGPMQQKVAAKVFVQIVSALNYLHQQKISHRDIKAENILLDFDMNAKLIDFGLSKSFDRKGDKAMLTTLCGSPSYTAPEIVLKQRYNAEMVDVWSLGVTLYTMLAAELPFGCQANQKTKKKIIDCSFYMKSDFSNQVQKLFLSIFKLVDHRATLEEIMQSDFFKKYNDWKPNFVNTQQESLLIDVDILSQIEKDYGFSKQLVKLSIQNCQPSQYSAMYYLKMKANSGEGIMSQSDLSSPVFIKSSRKAVSQTPNTHQDNVFRSMRSSQIMQPKRGTTLEPILPKQKKRESLSRKQTIGKNKIQLLNPEKKDSTFRVRIARPPMNMDLCRLRKIDESPESPKRILDWIGTYKQQVHAEY